MRLSVPNLLVLICAFASTLPVTGFPEERRCTDAYGKLLYVVAASGRVTDAHGKVIGESRSNGDVYDSHGKLFARKGDAGLLFALQSAEPRR